MGDEHGSPDKHGGPEKVVHHYPIEHYRYWRAHGVTSELLDRPGAFGENLTTVGMTEESLCVGDVYRVGDDGLVLQVSQVRQPCWKLNVRFDVPLMAANVQRACRHRLALSRAASGPDASGRRADAARSPASRTGRWRGSPTGSTSTRSIAPRSKRSRNCPRSPRRCTHVARRRLETTAVESWETRLTGR